MRRQVQQIFEGIRDLIAGLLKKAQAAGEIRPDLAPTATAGVILGLIEGAVLLDKTSQTQRETKNALAFIKSYLSA